MYNPVYGIVAILNSNLIKYELNSNRRSNIHIYPEDWKKLKIPLTTSEKQQPFIEIADQILESKKTGIDTTDLEKQIDQMVYELYSLTDDEIKIIVEGK